MNKKRLSNEERSISESFNFWKTMEMKKEDFKNDYSMDSLSSTEDESISEDIIVEMNKVSRTSNEYKNKSLSPSLYLPPSNKNTSSSTNLPTKKSPPPSPKNKLHPLPIPPLKKTLPPVPQPPNKKLLPPTSPGERNLSPNSSNQLSLTLNNSPKNNLDVAPLTSPEKNKTSPPSSPKKHFNISPRTISPPSSPKRIKSSPPSSPRNNKTSPTSSPSSSPRSSQLKISNNNNNINTDSRISNFISSMMNENLPKSIELDKCLQDLKSISNFNPPPIENVNYYQIEKALKTVETLFFKLYQEINSQDIIKMQFLSENTISIIKTCKYISSQFPLKREDELNTNLQKFAKYSMILLPIIHQRQNDSENDLYKNRYARMQREMANMLNQVFKSLKENSSFVSSLVQFETYIFQLENERKASLIKYVTKETAQDFEIELIINCCKSAMILILGIKTENDMMEIDYQALVLSLVNISKKIRKFIDIMSISRYLSEIETPLFSALDCLCSILRLKVSSLMLQEDENLRKNLFENLQDRSKKLSNSITEIIKVFRTVSLDQNNTKKLKQICKEFKKAKEMQKKTAKLSLKRSSSVVEAFTSPTLGRGSDSQSLKSKNTCQESAPSPPTKFMLRRSIYSLTSMKLPTQSDSQQQILRNRKSSDTPSYNQIFGVEIKNLPLDDNNLPIFLTTILFNLQEKSIEKQILFETSNIDRYLLEDFEKCLESGISRMEEQPIHILEAVLKDFFVKLPTPLLFKASQSLFDIHRKKKKSFRFFYYYNF